MKPNAPWRWIVGGLALAVVGVVVFAFIVTFDIPVEGRSATFLFLTPLGVGIAIYGLILWWRERSRARRN